MAKKDPRYKVVKIMVDVKHIKTFKEMFVHIPKTVVAGDLHVNNNKMTRLIEKPGGLTFDQATTLARLFGLPFETLSKMIEQALIKTKRNSEA